MKYKTKTKWIGMLMAVCMMLFTFMTAIMSVQAATPSLSGSRYIKTYPLSTGNNTPVYTSAYLNTRGTASPYRVYNATVYASDEIYVYSTTGNYSYISYPTSSGRRYGYIRTGDITSNNYSVDARTCRARIATYRRAGSTEYGYIDEGDNVYTVAKSGSYVQVVYPVGSVYKMGWITENNYNSYIAAQAAASLPASTDIANGDYYVKCAQNRNYAWDIEGAYQSVGANLMIYQAHGGDNQIFNFQKESDGCYTIKAKHSGQVLDVLGGGMGDGSNIVQSVSHGGDNQRWRITRTSDGYYSIISKSNGLYIDVQYNSMSNGTNVQCWSGNGTNAQKFRLESVSGSSQTAGFDPIWPCDTYTVTTLYKYSGGGHHSCHFKYGIDIGGRYGENVYAVESGTVMTVRNLGNRSFGKYIYIKHDNGRISVYAHLSSQNVTEGVRVSKGQVIGKVGNTGNVATHLHFELGHGNVSPAQNDGGDPWAEFYASKYSGRVTITNRQDRW